MTVTLSYDGFVTLVYDEVPGSINHGKNKRGKHWSVTSQEKSRWEGIYAMLALKEKLPRGLRFLSVNVELQFTTPNTKRDVENFRQPIMKPLADALVKGGWIEDDQEEFIVLERVRISKDKLVVTPAQKLLGTKGRMTIRLDYLLGSAHHAPFGAGGTDAGGEAVGGAA